MQWKSYEDQVYWWMQATSLSREDVEQAISLMVEMGGAVEYAV